MSIDVSQFLETFYEESFEGLDTMESELLGLDVGAADSETINTIFRAAHSIKGGSGTFGLNAVADYTHLMETLLDEMRDGRRQVTEEAVNILLSSVDVLREMLTALRANSELEVDRISEAQQQLEALLGTAGADSAAEVESGQNNKDSAERGWRISFKPHLRLFKTGNDPARIFRELQALGDLTVQMDASDLPEYSYLDPEESYLQWELELKGDIKREALDDVFAWVEDDCVINITPLEPEESEQGSAEEADKTEVAAVAVKTVERRVGERRQENRRKGDRRGSANNESTSIRVGINKVDAVINLVGELVITQSMLSTLGKDFNMKKINKLLEGLDQLELNTRELQEQVMRMRMMPISFAFQRFPRLVHDLSQKMGKKIELKMSGEQTELDKTVIEKIGDPLVHLVRNSLDHGIESPQQRKEAGKPETGILSLHAYHQGGNIVIEVADDGAGLNAEKILAKAIQQGIVQEDVQLEEEQIYELIMLPGFSTAEKVSDVSGRGVGMDVVVRNIQSLGGSLEVTSEAGKGSKFIIRLPLTLAILDGQTVAVGDEDYIVPLISIIESIQVTGDMFHTVAGKGETFRLRDEHLPIIRLHEIFGGNPNTTELTEGLLVVVEGEGRKVGLFVDDLKGQQQVVIKSLEANYKKVDGISGATILGDGSVALILDIPGLIRLSNQHATDDKFKKIA